MSEGLSPEQDSKAKSLHNIYESSEGRAAWLSQRMLDSGATEDTVSKLRWGAADELTDMEWRSIRKGEMGINNEVGDILAAAHERDASLYRAKEHKDEHLDQYIETARQEAEATGVEVKLPQDKE